MLKLVKPNKPYYGLAENPDKYPWKAILYDNIVH